MREMYVHIDMFQFGINFANERLQHELKRQMLKFLSQ